VARVLRSWGHQECVDVVSLLTSEVVTNALTHGGLLAAQEDLVINVACHDGRDGDVIRVDVVDAGAGELTVGDTACDAVSGRGLVLLEDLASAWEVRRAGSRKTVSFEVRTGPAFSS
jgi:anti-sigma regulatory factor (Ser/Thr protein kinase)